MSNIESNIELSKSDRITFIGLGKLGLGFALCFADIGYNVLGVDIIKDYVCQLNNRTYRTDEPMINELLNRTSNFNATTDLKQAILFSDYIFILVDTPETEKEYYDPFRLNIVLENISDLTINKPKNIIISTSVFTGYIKNYGLKIVNRHPGNQNTISYNPEIVRLGKIVQDIRSNDYPIIIGEANRQVGSFIEKLFIKIHKHNNITTKSNIHRMSIESAEICKFSTNCLKMIKITFANTIGDICDRVENTSKEDIMNAVKSDRLIKYGCLIPGYGYGGPCYPRDCKTFTKLLKQLSLNPCLFESNDLYNDLHSEYMAEIFEKENRKVYVFSKVCYRDDCPIPFIQNSQKLRVAEILANKNKHVIIKDKPDVISEVKKQYGDLFHYETEI